MNNKKSNSSSKIKNPVLLTVLLIAATISVSILYNYFIKAKLQEVYSLKETYKQASVLPILKSFNTEKLERKSFYRLNSSSITNYSNQVRAVSVNSSEPIAPEGVQIFDPKTGGALVIFWQKPINGDYQGVNIYRSEAPGQLGTVVMENLPKFGNYKDFNLKNGKKYYYTVKSFNNVNNEKKESGNVNYFEGIASDKTPPMAPLNFAITATGESKTLKLSWLNPEDEDFAYVNIYRSKKLGVLDDDLTPIKLSEAENYTDSEIEDNIIYYYTITAVDESGNESSRNLILSSGGNPNPFLQPANNSNING